MADQRRTAVLLIVLVLLDFIHCQTSYLYQTRRPTSATTLSGTSEKRESASPRDKSHKQETISKNGPAVDKTSIPTSTLFSSTGDRSSTTVSGMTVFDYLVTRLRSKYQFDGAINNTNTFCEELAASNFSQRIQEVPLAAELYQFSETIALLSLGCVQEAAGHFRKFEESVADPNFIFELFEAMPDSLNANVSVTGTDHHVPQNTSQLVEQLTHVEENIHLLQARSHSKTYGQLHCQWVASSITFQICQSATEINETNPLVALSVSQLLSAKLHCEKQEDKCDGVIEAWHFHRGQTMFFVFSHSSYLCLDENLTNTVSWLKQCYSDSDKRVDPPDTNRFIRKRDIAAQNKASAVLYEKENFSGESTIMSDNVDSLQGEWNDTISSLSCLNLTCTVIVFEHPYYEGRQRSFENEVTFVGRELDNAISSLVVVPYSIKELCYTVFLNQDFVGESENFCGDQDLTRTKWNNKIHSVAVDCDECSIVLYDRVFDGRFEAFTGNVSNVGSNWQHSVASIQVRPWSYDSYEGELEPLVFLFERPNYEGRSFAISGTIENVTDSSLKSVSSFNCSSLCTVLMFENESFTGNSRMYSGSQSNLGDLGLNHKPGSVVTFTEQYCVRFYEQKSQVGNSVQFCSDMSNLNHLSNRDFYSLTVECSQCSVAVYDEENFGGREEVFTGNVTDIGRRWYKLIRSFQIRPWIRIVEETEINNYAILYEHENFGGHAKVVATGASDYIGDALNDRVSSIYCEADCTSVVYEHANYEGDSILYHGSQNYLNEFNEKLSSIVILQQSFCVKFYEHPDYKGESVRYCQDVSDVGRRWHDQFSSMQIECSDCSVVIYEHPKYSGKHKSFAHSTQWFNRRWDDMISSVRIRPGKVDIDSEQDNCVDDEEQKAYDVIQWIPLVSLLYSLASSIYYGAVGCHSSAKERAIDMAIDVGMDAAMVLTGGAASGLALGIKTGAKVGVKVAFKTVAKAAAAAVKNSARRGIKALTKIGTQNIVRAAKSATYGRIKSLGKNVKELPGIVKSQIRTSREVINRASQEGFLRTTKRIGSGIKTGAKSKFDEMASKAQRQIDIDSRAKTKPKTNVGEKPYSSRRESAVGEKVKCRVRRMIKGNCNNVILNRQSFPPSKIGEDGIDRLWAAMNRAVSDSRVKRAEKFFLEIMNRPGSGQRMIDGRNQEIICKTFVMPNTMQPKEMFQNLQYYNHFMRPPDIGAVSVPLHVEANIGGEPIKFILTEGREKQIVADFYDKQFDVEVGHSYDYIVRVLDDQPLTRGQRAKAIVDAVRKPGNSQDWMKMNDDVFSPKQRESARELLVLTQVAECAAPWKSQQEMLDALKTALTSKFPDGGVPGMDKMARELMDEIASNPEKNSFASMFYDNTNTARFVMARKKGKNQMKNILFHNQGGEDRKSLNIRGQRMSSDSDARRRRRFA